MAPLVGSLTSPIRPPHMNPTNVATTAAAASRPPKTQSMNSAEPKVESEKAVEITEDMATIRLDRRARRVLVQPGDFDSTESSVKTTRAQQEVEVSQPLPLSLRINFADVTLGAVIGQGAFGRVHKGTWRNRPVAVKLLICQELKRDILEEFKSEVKIMSVLRHPNICQLLGACMEPPNRCLVVELVPRGSLWDVLRKHRFLHVAMRVRFILHTAKGMSYLHNFEPPILHRDLKSPNLLVDRDYSVKISDFGLSRVKAYVQTMTGSCGTMQWMAPEVLGNEKYTEKADVFSFGIVMWECLTGKCPYEGMPQIQAAQRILKNELRPAIPRSCPAYLAKLMKACWAHDPQVRPSFLQILCALQEEEYVGSDDETIAAVVPPSKAVETSPGKENVLVSLVPSSKKRGTAQTKELWRRNPKRACRSATS
ncbi:hypothetical protein AC1031_002991 [Aphanomyces cochlioides]|nr:hypothetical protein AC1031_002991 [Aphanomyces cochlioides]